MGYEKVKDILLTSLVTMVGIYVIKWVSAQVEIPVISTIAREV